MNEQILTTLEETIKARIKERAIRVSTVKEPHKYMKAVGTNEILRIIEEEFAKIRGEV